MALALVFFAAAAVGVELSREGGNVAAFWPPNAILLGVLMRGPRRDLTLPVGACALANLALNLLLGDPLPVATGFACANMLEVGCAYFLLARSAGLPSRLAGLHELLCFLFGAVLAAPAVAATVGAALVSWNFAAPFWTVWRTWWTADAVGMLLLAPVVATWDGWRQLRQLLAARGGWVTLELAGAGALIAGGLSVSILNAQPDHGYPGLFVLALLWLALRFGIGLTAAAAAAVCLTAVVATVHETWPLPFPAGDGSVAARITPLQLFVLSTVLPPLLVAAVVAERTRIEAELRRAKGLLDDALESMAEGFALFDAEQRLVFCNRRYLACFPRTAALRVPGARLPDLRRAAVALGEFRGVDERNGEDWAAEQARIHAAGGGGEYEFADGRWMLATSRKTADGGTVVVWHDTTERKTLELELATAKRRLDDALASMDDGLALYDSRERFILCNPRHREFFPRSADLRVPGAWVRDIWREEVRRRVYKNVDAGDVEAWIAERRAKATATGGGHEEVALADGRWLQFRVSPTAEGGTIVVARDVTECKQLERALTHQATHDALTGLPNRALFSDELRRARARAERDGTRLAVMLVDLDRFKEVNDTRGHTAGDELLVEAARRLRAAVREGDLVARLGGDEFAILAPDKAGGEGFATLARRVTERLAAPWRLGAVELRPGGTVGLTVYPDDPGGSAQLLVNADRALYAAKEAGRGTWASYRDDMRKGGGGSLALGAEVAGAVERGELDLDYQPILVVGTLEVVGVEALVRWDRPGRGRLPAGAFVPAAERGPAILSLTRFVLARATCGSGSTWPRVASPGMASSMRSPPPSPRRARTRAASCWRRPRAPSPGRGPRRRGSRRCDTSGWGSRSTTLGPATRPSRGSRRCRSTR